MIQRQGGQDLHNQHGDRGTSLGLPRAERTGEGPGLCAGASEDIFVREDDAGELAEAKGGASRGPETRVFKAAPLSCLLSLLPPRRAIQERLLVDTERAAWAVMGMMKIMVVVLVVVVRDSGRGSGGLFVSPRQEMECLSRPDQGRTGEDEAGRDQIGEHLAGSIWNYRT